MATIKLRDLDPAVFLNNVAIGTTSASSYSGWRTLTLAGDGTYGCLMDFFKGSTRMGSIYTNGITDFRIGSIANVPFYLVTNSQTRMTISTAGNIGTPYAFHVTNGGSASAGNAFYSPAPNEMGISTNGVERIRIGSQGNITAYGTFQHGGLSLGTGTAVDQLTTFTKTMQLDSPTYWFDTGIDDGDLATGVYIFSMYVSDYGVGGAHYDETYSGVMSWFASSTNSSANDEITLHRAGHAPNAGVIQLRTIRSSNSGPHDLKLQIKHNQTCTGSSNYVFKFRRMI